MEVLNVVAMYTFFRCNTPIKYYLELIRLDFCLLGGRWAERTPDQYVIEVTECMGMSELMGVK